MKSTHVLRFIAAFFGLATVAAAALLLTPRGVHVTATPIGQVYW